MCVCARREPCNEYPMRHSIDSMVVAHTHTHRATAAAAAAGACGTYSSVELLEFGGEEAAQYNSRHTAGLFLQCGCMDGSQQLSHLQVNRKVVVLILINAKTRFIKKKSFLVQQSGAFVVAGIHSIVERKYAIKRDTRFPNAPRRPNHRHSSNQQNCTLRCHTLCTIVPNSNNNHIFGGQWRQ